MAEPIRSDTLASLLQVIFGGSGQGYSFPFAEGVGPIVLSNDANAHALEHERMHIAAGPNKQRNQTIDTMEFIPDYQFRDAIPPMNAYPPLTARSRPSPDEATRMMAARENQMRVQQTIAGYVAQGVPLPAATRAAYNAFLKGGR